jgi:hypothetical protein
MEKKYPAIVIQMSCKFVNTINGSNGENYRDLLFHIPRQWLNLEHKKNKESE